MLFYLIGFFGGVGVTMLLVAVLLFIDLRNRKQFRERLEAKAKEIRNHNQGLH